MFLDQNIIEAFLSKILLDAQFFTQNQNIAKQSQAPGKALLAGLASLNFT